MRINTIWYDTFGLQAVPSDVVHLFGSAALDGRLKEKAVGLPPAGRDARATAWCITPIGLCDDEVKVLVRALRDVAALACENGMPRTLAEAIGLVLEPRPLTAIDGEGLHGILMERFTAELRLGAKAKAIMGEIVRPANDSDYLPRGFRLNVLGYYTLAVDDDTSPLAV